MLFVIRHLFNGPAFVFEEDWMIKLSAGGVDTQEERRNRQRKGLCEDPVLMGVKVCPHGSRASVSVCEVCSAFGRVWAAGVSLSFDLSLTLGCTLWVCAAGWCPWPPRRRSGFLGVCGAGEVWVDDLVAVRVQVHEHLQDELSARLGVPLRTCESVKWEFGDKNRLWKCIWKWLQFTSLPHGVSVGFIWNLWKGCYHQIQGSSPPGESTWSSPPEGPSCSGTEWLKSSGTRGRWWLCETALCFPPCDSAEARNKNTTMKGAAQLRLTVKHH